MQKLFDQKKSAPDIAAAKQPDHLYWLSSLTVGGHTACHVLCGEVPAGADALLGQSFFKQFNSVSINNTAHTLTLG